MNYKSLLLSIIATTLFCIDTSGQNEKIGEAFIWGYDRVSVYDQIQGSKIGIIQNNKKEEIYYSIEVYDQQDDWFKIQATFYRDTVRGWIFNESYLATYSRNYTDTLFIYTELDKKEVNCFFSYWLMEPMLIEEFKGNWVKIRIEDIDTSCKGGWIMQDMTCSSPYTTCN